MNKKWKKCLLCMLFFCTVFLYTGCAKKEKVYLKEDEIKEESVEKKEASTEHRAEEETIFVYVCGAVHKPGVYELAPDKRVCDALQAAGGLTKEAAADELNQAAALSDGQMIRVYTAEEEAVNKEKAKEEGLVNINTASEEELMNLPGIGQSKAEAVVAYRKEHGAFKTTEELMNISGIKEGVYNKIKSSITVN